MEKNELRENDIKNHACYHFDDVMRVIDINSRDILLDGKRYENNLILDISYKTFMGSIPLHIRFDEIDGFIKVYDGIRYLVSFSNSWYDTICDKIKELNIVYVKKWYHR